MRRTTEAGRNWRPRSKKRGAKSMMRMAEPSADIGLARGALAVQQDAELPAPADKAVEDRFAVEARQAEPHHGALAIDQAGHGAIADNAQFQRVYATAA